MKRSLIVNKAGKTGGIPEILLYGDIDSDMAADFARELLALEKTHAEINCRVNSDGGSVYNGIAIFNLVRQSPADIDMYIDGIAASMASAIPMAGRKVYMNKYARLMTHKPSGGAWGNSDDLRRTADEVDACEGVLVDMYMAKTGLTAEEVKAKFLNGKDKWFSAQQAMDAGLIDGLYDGEQVDVTEQDDMKTVYNKFQTKLMAKLDNNEGVIKTDNMEKREIPLAIWAKMAEALGIQDSASDKAIEASFKKLADKAASYDTLKETHETVKAELQAERTKVTTEKVKNLLGAAVTAKKITVAVSAQLEKDYASNPDGLDVLLKGMPAYEPITNKLNDGDVPAEYAGKSWDELMEMGKIGEIKATNKAFYNQIFKKAFGKEPAGE